ncbi:phosphatidylserine decarboxylase, partial [Nonomuraea sp. NPDC004297]
ASSTAAASHRFVALETLQGGARFACGRHWIAGGFLPAFNKDSDQNERVVWHFETALGDIEMVQIAGAVARRIVPYLSAGAKVEQAERIGLIRFGSRVDIYLPERISPAVSVGEKTVAGVTRIDRG